MSVSNEASEATGSEGIRVIATRIAKEEGRAVLTDFQYLHVKQLVERLVDFGNKAATADLDIAPFGDFWELKLKHGPLRRLNIRVYFAYVPEQKAVVVLKTYKKEEDRRVSPGVMITLEDRLEGYLKGETQGISVYRTLGR